MEFKVAYKGGAGNNKQVSQTEESIPNVIPNVTFKGKDKLLHFAGSSQEEDHSLQGPTYDRNRQKRNVKVEPQSLQERPAVQQDRPSVQQDATDYLKCQIARKKKIEVFPEEDERDSGIVLDPVEQIGIVTKGTKDVAVCKQSVEEAAAASRESNENKAKALTLIKKVNDWKNKKPVHGLETCQAISLDRNLWSGQSLHLVENSNVNAGSFGWIRKCIDVQKRTRLVLKIIKEQETVNINEVQVPHLLRSPHVARIAGVYWDTKNLSLIQEDAGCSLKECVKKSKKFLDCVHNEKTFLNLIEQLLKGLCHFELYGIVHTDVKPENLTCDLEAWPPRIKFIDFGSSQTRQDPTSYKGMTPEYLPPILNEFLYSLIVQSRGDMHPPAVDHLIDVWGVGMVISFCIIKMHPMINKFIGQGDYFPKDLPGKRFLVMKKISEMQDPLPKELTTCPWSEDITYLLQNLLKVDASKRWTAQQALDYVIRCCDAKEGPTPIKQRKRDNPIIAPEKLMIGLPVKKPEAVAQPVHHIMRGLSGEVLHQKGGCQPMETTQTAAREEMDIDRRDGRGQVKAGVSNVLHNTAHSAKRILPEFPGKFQVQGMYLEKKPDSAWTVQDDEESEMDELAASFNLKPGKRAAKCWAPPTTNQMLNLDFARPKNCGDNHVFNFTAKPQLAQPAQPAHASSTEPKFKGNIPFFDEINSDDSG